MNNIIKVRGVEEKCIAFENLDFQCVKIENFYNIFLNLSKIFDFRMPEHYVFGGPKKLKIFLEVIKILWDFGTPKSKILEVKFMAMFMAHLTHSVEACYVVNEENKKKLKELSSKREEIAKKHEIKVISAVYPPLEHEIFYVMEAPSFRNVELYLREIGFALYNKIKIRHVASMEKALDVLQK